MNLIYLFCLILFPNRPLPKFKRPIYSIRPDHTPGVLETPLGRVLLRNNLSEISLWAVLTRQVLFLDFLRSNVARTKKELLLVRVSRFLFLDVRFCLTFAGLQDLCFNVKAHGTKVMYSYHPLAVEILSTYWKGYQQVLARYDCQFWAQRLFYYCLKLNAFRLCQNESKGLSLFINVYNASLIKAYLLINPNRQIIIRYFDDLDLHFKRSIAYFRTFLNDLTRRFPQVHVESYSQKDALRLGAQYVPNSIQPDSLPYEAGRQYLVTFFGSGSGSSNRSLKFKALKAQLSRLKIPDRFVHVFLYETLADSLKNKPLPYLDYLSVIERTEVVIDFYRLSPDEGYSYRIPEALFMNKKIITDRPQVLQESFYSPDRIFCVGHDSWDRLPSFLQAEIEPLPEHVLKPFDVRYWAQIYDGYLEHSGVTE